MDAKGGHYDVQIKRAGWISEGHYDVQIKRVDGKGGIMMCKLKGRMERRAL